MSQDDLTAIVPVLIVTLAACACLVAESFRRKGERMAVRASSASSASAAGSARPSGSGAAT